VIICLEWGANNFVWSNWCHCHPIVSCFIKIQIGLVFLVLAYLGCAGKETVKRVSFCLVCLFCCLFVNFWAIVCKTVRHVLSDRCLSVCLSCSVCLSVTLVYCGQMVWWIKMKLGLQVGVGPRHIVLDGDPALPASKGHSPLNFRPISVAATKWLHRSRCHLVWGYALAQATLC